MSETVAPNPPSPFADADPQFRHILPTFSPAFLFGPPPEPGHLAMSGCGLLAVVPTEPLRDAVSIDQLPDGLCPLCLADMNAGARGTRLARASSVIVDCRTCGARTAHTTVCAVCRLEMHDQWLAAGSPQGVTLEDTVNSTLASREHLAKLDEKEAVAGPAEDSGEDAEEKYPAQICVNCDDCGTVHSGDYVVTDAMTSPQRLEAARAHLRTLGWSCTAAGDYCPKDAPRTATTTTLFEAEDTHYGIAVSHIGDDGEGLIAIGHHPMRRVIAAFNRHHRRFVGLACLHDDRSQHVADIEKEIKTVWVIFRKPNPDAPDEDPDYNWYVDTVGQDAPGAVPVMWLDPR